MIDTAALQPWLGRSTESVDTVSGPLAARLAAMLDWPDPPVGAGQVIPAGWYVMLFAPLAPQSSLARDGHPPKGDLLPPVPLPRRMFAGRRVSFHDALRIGDPVTRVSRVAAITPKSGRSGPMCFVTVRHEIASARGLAVVEEQEIVYRSEPAAGTPAERSAGTPVASPAGSADPVSSAPPRAAPAAGLGASRVIRPDPTLLFRYSAITHNAHRIHYDQAYARDVEGYPDLVVNGGLPTLLLWTLAEATAGARLSGSRSRNLAPLFVNRTLTLRVGPREGAGARAWVEDDAGRCAIDAELEFR